MSDQNILAENGKYKARIFHDGYTTSLLTQSNGYQWSGATISPELAKLSIKVLQRYLNGELDNPHNQREEVMVNTLRTKLEHHILDMEAREDSLRIEILKLQTRADTIQQERIKLTLKFREELED